MPSTLHTASNAGVNKSTNAGSTWGPRSELPAAAIDHSLAAVQGVVYALDDQCNIDRGAIRNAVRGDRCLRVAEGDVHHGDQPVHGDAAGAVTVAGTGNGRWCARTAPTSPSAKTKSPRRFSDGGARARRARSQDEAGQGSQQEDRRQSGHTGIERQKSLHPFRTDIALDEQLSFEGGEPAG
jgi:hypothetical protein